MIDVSTCTYVLSLVFHPNSRRKRSAFRQWKKCDGCILELCPDFEQELDTHDVL